MKKTLRRRDFLKTAAAGTAAVAVGFPAVARGAKPYDGKTLSVFTYAGAFESTVKKHMLKSFEERTGARVKLEAGWWDMLPKLKASPPGQPAYDVVITDPTQGFPSIKEGLFQKYDPANVPNAKKIHGAMQENWIQADNWGVNLSGSMMAMAFHTELVSNVPQHWHDMLRDDLAGKLSFYNAPYMSLFTFAQMKAGMEGNPGGGRDALAKDLDGVLQFCKDKRDICRVWWTSTGDFMGKLLKSVVPSEGTASVHIFWTVTNGTKEKPLAEEWINQFFGTEFQVKWGSVGKLAVPNLEAAPLAGEENAFYKRFLPTSKEDWDRIVFYPYDIYFEGDNWAKINDFWDREVIRKKG
jgi:spermidine/putrescine-binding protein